jgi:hypothetical protein
LRKTASRKICDRGKQKAGVQEERTFTRVEGTLKKALLVLRSGVREDLWWDVYIKLVLRQLRKKASRKSATVENRRRGKKKKKVLP